MNDLKECPFCGNAPYIKDYNSVDGNIYIVSCPFCNAEINDPSWTIDEAVKKWNKRETIDLLKEQENASKRNPVIVCPHCGKRVK